jgi:hypothetical protein
VDLGPCCICGESGSVHAAVMLPFKAPMRRGGWGCFVCGLPAEGASAVVCDSCVDGWRSGQVKLQFACRGYPATDGRVPIGELVEPHDHDMSIDH